MSPYDVYRTSLLSQAGLGHTLGGVGANLASGLTGVGVSMVGLGGGTPTPSGPGVVPAVTSSSEAPGRSTVFKPVTVVARPS